MTSRSKNPPEICRARPLLGTLVEVRAAAPSAGQAERAVNAAFAAIKRVHHLMSFHEPESDVGRLNRIATHRSVRVHAWTHLVLRRASRLHADTGGLFDIAIAPSLVRGGWLPRPAVLPAAGGTTADIALSAGNQVRFRRPLLIDLGGIAKGFAVDQAIAALRRSGATNGVVNAGGDLRVFGAQPALVHVRLPESPGTLVSLGHVSNGAVATSAHYFAQRRVRGAWRTPICHPSRRNFTTQACSVSVMADECWLADALCKVVWLAGAAAMPLLQKHGARARTLDACVGQGYREDHTDAA